MLRPTVILFLSSFFVLLRSEPSTNLASAGANVVGRHVVPTALPSQASSPHRLGAALAWTTPPLHCSALASSNGHRSRIWPSSGFASCGRKQGCTSSLLSVRMSERSNRGQGNGRRVLRVTLEDMHEGMELEGIIRSVKPYGAFVDVGSTTDGLLHISQMLPVHRQYKGNEMVVTASEGEQILVEVMNVDLRTRKFAVREVQLSWTVPRKKAPASSSSAPPKPHLDLRQAEELYAGILTGDEEDTEEVERRARDSLKQRQGMEKWARRMKNRGFFSTMKAAAVKSVTEYGAFIDLGGPADGLLHVSQMEGRAAVSRGGKIVLKAGDSVQVRILEIDVENRRVSLTQKRAEEEEGKLAADAEAMAVLEAKRAEEEEEGAGTKNAFAKAFEKAVRDSQQ